MKKEELVKVYEENMKHINSMIMQMTMFTNEKDEKMCKVLENGLSILAESGNKNAAAMYGMVVAYIGEDEFFSKKTACQLIFQTNAIKEYQELVEEELLRDSVWPECDCERIRNAPFMWWAMELCENEGVEE
ncbi:MAG: hypothetical protein IKY23_10305 [Lachnospiraceae bacterium]|nr:hypothetical protein [Lachnospiraceae bacterium]